MSRDPAMPDPETLGLQVRYRTPRHFLLYTMFKLKQLVFNSAENNNSSSSPQSEIERNLKYPEFRIAPNFEGSAIQRNTDGDTPSTLALVRVHANFGTKQSDQRASYYTRIVHCILGPRFSRLYVKSKRALKRRLHR